MKKLEAIVCAHTDLFWNTFWALPSLYQHRSPLKTNTGPIVQKMSPFSSDKGQREQKFYSMFIFGSLFIGQSDSDLFCQ